MRRFGIAFAALACCCSSLALASGEGKAHVNWWAWDMHAPPIGWFIINFVLFVGLLVYVTKGPIKNALTQRHETIKRTIADNVQALASAQDRHKEARGKLSGVEAESIELLKITKAQAETERDRLVEAAQAYAERLTKDSEALVDQELTRAFGRLRKEVAGEALGSAEAMLRREISAADQTRLLEEAIAALDNGAKPSSEFSKARQRRSEQSVGGSP